ncbi:RNA polymerase sigma factor [Aquimarina sediminis]|uniref:RNA polymerase sigma factor n=1 Tax=Aquimarina sediminis TaxID=2070536 RepID=UPI000CA03BA2|nr:RNA polymerase sigma factor [Aquimarina sediminis]
MTNKEFEVLYKEYLPNLKSFFYRFTTNKETTEDLAQETFIIAYKNVSKFKGESSFKTWLFGIGVNVARNNVKSLKRWPINAQDLCKTSIHQDTTTKNNFVEIYNNPELGKYEAKEHIDFCFTCLAKTLTIEQQIAIILADVYSFKVKEISTILEKSYGQVKHYLHNGRKTLDTIFENRCSLVNKKGTCYQCSELNNKNKNTNTQLTLVSIAKNKKNLNLYKLRTNIIKAIDPINCSSFNIHNFLINQTEKAVSENKTTTNKTSRK